MPNKCLDFRLTSGITLPLAPCLVAAIEEDSKHLMFLFKHEGNPPLLTPSGMFVNMYVYRYQNMPTEALSFFNHARKDSEWGEKALFNMIMICLNPDNETLGGETFKPLETESG